MRTAVPGTGAQERFQRDSGFGPGAWRGEGFQQAGEKLRQYRQWAQCGRSWEACVWGLLLAANQILHVPNIFHSPKDHQPLPASIFLSSTSQTSLWACWLFFLATSTSLDLFAPSPHQPQRWHAPKASIQPTCWHHGDESSAPRPAPSSVSMMSPTPVFVIFEHSLNPLWRLKSFLLHRFFFFCFFLNCIFKVFPYLLKQDPPNTLPFPFLLLWNASPSPFLSSLDF